MKRSLIFIALSLFIGAGCAPTSAPQAANYNFPKITPNTDVAAQPKLPPLADPTANANLLPEQAAPVAQFVVGARIFAAWKGGAVWYPGKISAISGKLYTIAYDDGDTEKDVTEPRMVLTSNSPIVDTFKSGETVIAQSANNSWYKGTVVKDRGATVLIIFDDKTQDSIVREKVIPLVTHEKPPTAEKPAAAAAEKFPVGAHVLANWHAGPRWWDAVVTGKNAGGYTITYSDDHSTDTLSAAALANYPRGASHVAPGDKIIARSKNGYWYNATVDSVTDGVINITFFDGFKQPISASDLTRAGS